MNFNLTHSPEYKLYASMTNEIISLYGVECSYCVAERIHKDEIFGEHQRIGIDSKDTYKIKILPQEMDNWSGESVMNAFGLNNNESMTCFISKETMLKIHPNIVTENGYNYDFIIGDLVIFPSGKIMEVSMISPLAEATLNNLFVYDDEKNVYKLTLKTFVGAPIDKTEADSYEYEKVENLEEIFELDKERTTQQDEHSTKVGKVSNKRSVTKKDGYNDVFGSLG